MSKLDPFGRHPLCTCGPVTFFRESALVTVESCREHAKTIYGIDPHPVLDLEDLAELSRAFRKRFGLDENSPSR